MKTQSGDTAGRHAALSVPVLILAFLLLTSVRDWLPQLGIFDGKRVLQVCLVPLLFLPALLAPGLRAAVTAVLERVPKWIFAGLFVFFVLGVVSSLRHPHPGYYLTEVALLFSLTAAAFVVAAARIAAGSPFDRLCLWLLAGLGAFVALQEAMGLLAHWSLGSEMSYDEMFIYFAHPRFYNQLQTWTVPLLAALPFVTGYGKKWVFAATLLLGMQWYLLLASGARGSIVGIAAALVLVGALALPASIKWLKVQASGLLLGAGAWFSVLWLQAWLTPSSGQFLAQSLGRDMTTSTGRSWFWQVAWREAAQHPWLGMGPGRFGCDLRAALPAHPHDILLQLLSEWGFPAVLMVIAVLGYVAFRLIAYVRCVARTAPRGGRELNLSLAAALVAAAAHACVSGLLVMPASQLMSPLAGGWLLGLAYRNGGPAAAPLLTRAMLCAALLTSSSVAVFALREAPQLAVRQGGFSQRERSMPRFWQEGRACRYTYGQQSEPN